MSGSDKPHRPSDLVTEDEFLALPETLEKTELIDGVIVREPSPGFGHQSAMLSLAVGLRAWAATRTPQPDVCVSPLDVRFARGRILQPDAFVFLSPLERPVLMPIARIPDLCIEVISGRPVYDRTTKRLLYAEAGVRELWTVRQGGNPLLERWTGPHLEERHEAADAFSSPLLPGFTLDITSLDTG